MLFGSLDGIRSHLAGRWRFREGIEVFKSETALCESIGKWVSQSLEKSYKTEKSENRKFSNRDLSALEPGYRCWGV